MSVPLFALDLLRRQEELRRMEEAHSQEVQKRKQMELRQEEERRRREEELRAHSEDLMRRQQGQGGNFSEKVRLGFQAPQLWSAFLRIFNSWALFAFSEGCRHEDAYGRWGSRSNTQINTELTLGLLNILNTSVTARIAENLPNFT